MDELTGNSTIQQEVRTLRTQVAGLERWLAGRHQLSLQPVQVRPWLGQAVTVQVTVRSELDQQPRIDLPVTVVTTWGHLRTTGDQVQEGTTVVTRTDVAGVSLVTLLPPAAEQVWALQQGALETMLAGLDGNAATPRAIEGSLRELVRRYGQEANTQFRQAVDRYFQFFYQAQFEQVTRRDQLQAWHYYNATVLAFAGDTPPGVTSTGQGRATAVAGVQGAAVLPLRFKDWLGPWLQTYLTVAKGAGDLTEQLRLLAGITQDPQTLLEATQSLLQDALGRTPGLVTEQITQRAATAALHTFLGKGLDDLPDEARHALFSGLEQSATQIKTVGLRAQTHLRLGKAQDAELENKLGQLTDQQTLLGERLLGMEGLTSNLRTTFTQLQSELVTLDSRITTGLQERITHAAFAQFQEQTKVAFNDLERSALAINRQLDKVQGNFSEIQGTVRKLGLDLDVVREELKLRPRQLLFDELQANLAALTTTFTTLQQDLRAFRGQVNSHLQKTVSLADFTQWRSELTTNLATKLDRTEMEAIKKAVDLELHTFRTTFTTIDQHVSEIRNSFRQLDRSVLKIRNDVDKLKRP